MTQEEFNEIRDKHPSAEAEIEYQQRLLDEGVPPVPTKEDSK